MVTVWPAYGRLYDVGIVRSTLDAKYESAELKKVINQSTNLNKVEKTELYELLLKYEDMFDGTLGKWRRTPHSIRQ